MNFLSRARTASELARVLVPAVAVLATSIVSSGCGERDDAFDAPIGLVQSFGLDARVAVVDDGAHRVLLLAPHDGLELERSSVGIGRNVMHAEASTDGKRLFVLSAGDTARKKSSDEKPSLTVIDDGANGSAAVHRRYSLESPHSGMAVDPQGRWVALFAAPASSGAYGARANFVENPNEILLVDLSAAEDAAVTARTIRSFGGLPQRVSFSPTLGLPGGARRLLVVETDQDVTLLDLDHVGATPSRPEVTVRLTSGSSTGSNRPGGVVFDDGDPARTDDARLGVRLENATSVVTLTLVANGPDAKTDDPSMVPNDFRPLVNLADVGGIAADISFVRTELGRRLVAVVPQRKQAVLVDPDTSVATSVDLPSPYARISLITDVVGGADGTDTALLYGATGASGVAFWSLGRAEGQPYRSVEVVSLTGAIDEVLDVPPPRPELKILRASTTNAFYVLNLATRTASPLLTQGSANLTVARDGERLWAYQSGSSNLARVSLSDLHPVPLPLDRSIQSVFDVARSDGGRVLVAFDARGAGGATVLDALTPDPVTSASYYGLLLEEL